MPSTSPTLTGYKESKKETGRRSKTCSKNNNNDDDDDDDDAMMLKSTLAALAVAALSSSSSSSSSVLAASPSLSVQALQEGKVYYAKDVPEMKLAKGTAAKAGTLDCRSKRTIPTWNNEEVAVCDAGLCKGAEAMPKLTVEDKQAPPRFSDAQLSRYMKALGEFFLFFCSGERRERKPSEEARFFL